MYNKQSPRSLEEIQASSDSNSHSGDVVNWLLAHAPCQNRQTLPCISLPQHLPSCLLLEDSESPWGPRGISHSPNAHELAKMKHIAGFPPTTMHVVVGRTPAGSCNPSRQCNRKLVDGFAHSTWPPSFTHNSRSSNCSV